MVTGGHSFIQVINKSKMGIMAVSYTHLDVYKRQMYMYWSLMQMITFCIKYRI